LVNVTFSPSAYPGLLHVEVCQEVYENLQELCVRANIRRAKMLEKSSSLVLFVCFLSCVPAPFGNSRKREKNTQTRTSKAFIYTCVCANAHVYRAGGDNLILTCKYFGIMLILYLLPIGVLALIEACFCIEAQQISLDLLVDSFQHHPCLSKIMNSGVVHTLKLGQEQKPQKVFHK
jgi:hypothetical protein